MAIVADECTSAIETIRLEQALMLKLTSHAMSFSTFDGHCDENASDSCFDRCMRLMSDSSSRFVCLRNFSPGGLPPQYCKDECWSEMSPTR